MFSYSHWLALPMHIKQKIALKFNIPKVRSTHVANNVIVDDGYNIKDVEAVINVDCLQSELQSTETDLAILFNRLVESLTTMTQPITVLPAADAKQFSKEYEERTGKVAPKLSGKKLGRPRKHEIK